MPSSGCVGNVDPIFIPSKGRFAQRNFGTHVLLAAAGMSFTLVVEPQEAQQYGDLLMSLPGYDASLHKIAVLPKSNQGISFVRNIILRDFAPSGWFWVMDDDIRSFNRGLRGRNEELTPGQLFAMLGERFAKYSDISLFSLEYEQFCFSYGPGDIAVNSYNNIAIRVNKADVADHIEYRFSIREDYDFTLQMILSGRKTLRFRDLSYRVPKMCACSGGMTDYYNEKKAEIREQNRRFIAMWPSVSREVLKGSNKDVRYDIRVLWVKLNPERGADPIAVLKSRVPLPEVAEIVVPKANVQKAQPARKAGLKRERPLEQDESASLSSTCSEESSSMSSPSGSSDGESASSDSFDMKAYEESLPLQRPNRVPAQRELTPRPPTPTPPTPIAKKKSIESKASKGAQLDVASFFKNVPKKAPEEKVHIARSWRGYALEWYRDIGDDLALECGLKRYEPMDVSVGDSVFVIPTKIAVTPCVLEGTVIDKWYDRKAGGGFEFSVVPARRYKGVDVQHCAKVYALADGMVHTPETLTKLEVALNAAIKPPSSPLTFVTTENLKEVEMHLKSLD